MLSPRWRKIWADLKVSKTRTALVVMSIVVGIFAVGSIAGTSAILDREIKGIWRDTIPSSADLITTVFDPSVAEQVEALPEIDTVQLRRSYDARVQLGNDEFADIRIFTVPDYEAINLNLIRQESGEFPPPNDAILIERSAMSTLGAIEGEDLTIILPTGEEVSLPVVGQAWDFSQPSAAVLGTGYGYVSMTTMESLTGDSGFNTLQFRVADNLDDSDYVESVANSIRDTLESQGTIVFTQFINNQSEPPSYVFTVALLLVLGVIGSLTFLLSGFLIVNIISALLTQQTKQIGVMKAIGARTGQIIRMYLGMAGAFGVFALIIGLPLSFLGARELTSLVGSLNNAKITNFTAPWWVFGIQIIIGLVVPILAAFIPIWMGTRTSVREALDTRGISTRDGLMDRLLTKFGGFGISRPLMMSFRNTFRQKGRLMLTLATLTLAGAIFATIFTVRNSLFNTLDDALGYDNYDIRVDLNDAYAVDALTENALAVEGVESIEAWSTAVGRYIPTDGEESDDINLNGIPIDSQTILPLMEAGRWLEAEDSSTNALVINNNISINENVTVGDEITLIIRGQESTWRVVGIARAIFSFENVAWTPYDTLSETINESGLSRTVRLITTEHSKDFQTSIIEAITTEYTDADLLVESTESFSAIKSSLDTQFNTLIYSLLALAGLLALVGGLGIAGTTSVNVLERLREIGIMRSVGGANYQILRIFILEAVFVGIIGWVLGSILALPISRLLSDGVGNAFSNAPLSYSFDVLGILLWLILAVVLAIISSYLPARRASRVTLREVLNYEG